MQRVILKAKGQYEATCGLHVEMDNLVFDHANDATSGEVGASGHFSSNRVKEETAPNNSKLLNNYVALHIHQGDLVHYSNHISIVYEDPKDDGTYQIVHAYGIRCIDKDGDGCDPEEFSRKVLVTDGTFAGFPAPTGFGRVKLWD